jgi:archaemetzincin
MGGIVLLPYPGVEAEVLDYLQERLPAFLPAQVSLGPEQPQPDFAYDEERGQYFADAVLATLRALPLNQDERGLAVLSADIFTLKLNYLFGLADPEAGFGIVSLHRLRPGFYGHNDDGVLKMRVLKEAVHELGHTYKLDHCSKRHCVMYFSSSLRDTDNKGPAFCDTCLKKTPSSGGSSLS